MSVRSMISKYLIMPSLLRFSHYPPWPWYAELMELDRAERKDLKRLQWKRFKSLFAHAQENVPYYEEAFGKKGLRADDLKEWDDLLEVPVITKRQIAANFPDRITVRDSNRDTWQYFATSGTTDRLMVIKDAEASSRNMALSLYEERIQDTYSPGMPHVSIPPDACSLACAVNIRRSQGALERAKQTILDLLDMKAADIPRSVAGRILRNVACPTYEMPSFGPEGTRVSDDTLKWYIQEIRRQRPVVLSGLPTYLQILARYIRRSGEDPLPIGSLLPQGALSPTTVKKEIAEVFGVPVHEVYGGHEFGCVGSTCKHRDKLHTMMPECLVEIVHNGKHVPAGHLGEIIVTVFSNRVMPLIRYCPGDVGRLYEDYCACGRKTQLLFVEGRMQDTLVTSKGIRTEKEVVDFLMTWPNVEFAQLVQRGDTRCDLLIVEKEKGNTKLKDLSDATGSFLGDRMEVRPRLVSTIKPEISGKFRFVKSLSFEHFHEISSTMEVGRFSEG